MSHDFGHSFISTMNYIHNDYFLGHLLRQARKTKINKLTVDILGNHATPKELLTQEIETAINYYYHWFPNLVNQSGSTMDFVKTAMMMIEFDLEKTRLFSMNKNYVENPFWCEITIEDDRGKVYRHKHEGWWFPEAS